MHTTLDSSDVPALAAALEALLPLLARGKRPLTYSVVGPAVGLDRSSPLLAAALTWLGRKTLTEGRGNWAALVTRSGPRSQRMPGPGYFNAFHPEATPSQERSVWLADHNLALLHVLAMP